MIQTDILRLSIERRRAITTKESMVTESTKKFLSYPEWVLGLANNTSN